MRRLLLPERLTIVALTVFAIYVVALVAFLVAVFKATH
jgi:hypothetical protein